MKVAGRVGICQHTKVIGYMKIKRIDSRCFKYDVLRSISERLHCKHKFYWEFGIVRAQENSHLELLTLEKGERFDLNILVVNQNVICSQFDYLKGLA